MNSFDSEYGRCDVCGTLVYKDEAAIGELLANDDENGFYGRQYWLGHQRDSLGFPDIHQRARSDLAERNLYWLATLLQYLRPPAKVLELGCSHGSFVALLDQAGFDATGVEMSQWVVDFGRRTFDVPVVQGPVESLGLPEASLDAVVLMDVLEHLPDPHGTMAECLRLLKPEGLLLIQTPEFRQEMTHASLVQTQSRFLGMLQPIEHLYLFSRESVTRFFHEIGADHIHFEDAIFSHYDMFFAVSRVPLIPSPLEEADKALMASSRSRLVLALLDVYRREVKGQARLRTEIQDLETRLSASEADRAARLEVIERQGDSIGRLSGLSAELDSVRTQLATSEADRAARLQVIEQQGQEIGRLSGLSAELDELRARLAACEQDRAARLQVIESQGAQLGHIADLESDLATQAGELAEKELLQQGLQSDVAARSGAKLGAQIRNRLAKLRRSIRDDEDR